MRFLPQKYMCVNLPATPQLIPGLSPANPLLPPVFEIKHLCALKQQRWADCRTMMGDIDPSLLRLETALDDSSSQ